MKKKALFILPIITLLSVTGCFETPKKVTVHYTVEDEYLIPTESGVNKVKNKYNYSDYTYNSVYNQSSCPSVGEPNILVIPIWFTDSSAFIKKKDQVREDIETAYFGSAEETGWESVSSYYEKDSFGHVSLKGVVSDWYECGESSEDYYYSYKQVGPRSYVDVTAELVKKAVSWYKETNNTDLVDYDLDKDGYLDGVILIYGAPDCKSLGKPNEAQNLWGYTSWVLEKSQKSLTSPGANVFFWASYDFMYDQYSALTHAGSTYSQGDTSNSYVDSHCFIHEMGHVFGLQDYYDYNKYDPREPAGTFSMQDYNVGAHDPFSRYALGWITPYLPTTSMDIDLKTIESSGEAILLGNYFDGSPFDEYILLELYSPTGLNEFDTVNQYKGAYATGPEITGIRLWHVDARLFHFNNPLLSSKGNVTTNPYEKNVYNATSNTSYSKYENQAINLAGKYSYDTLYLVRKGNEQWSGEYPITDGALFVEGDTFTIRNFQRQFPEKITFNSGKSFDWKITVNSITGDTANISLKLG